MKILDIIFNILITIFSVLFICTCFIEFEHKPFFLILALICVSIKFTVKCFEKDDETPKLRSGLKLSDYNFQQITGWKTIEDDTHFIEQEKSKERIEHMSSTKGEAKSTAVTKESANRIISINQQTRLPSTPNNVLRIMYPYGTNSRKAYLECCQLFGWDKSEACNFGRQGAALYAKGSTKEGFSPWFIANHNLNHKKGGKWKNTIDGEFIYEEWDEVDEGLWNDKTIRVIFIKLGSIYYFYGVFCVDNIELKANSKYTKTYRRVSREYTYTV